MSPRRILLQTGNVMLFQSHGIWVHEKSNKELISSLKTNLLTNNITVKDIESTTKDQKNLIWVPQKQSTLLKEPEENYDITLKLFFLPRSSESELDLHVKEAIDAFRQVTGINRIGLVIVSFTGITFDADDDQSLLPSEAEISRWIRPWRVLQNLVKEGSIGDLGVSEFSIPRLTHFLSKVEIPPSVNQLNLRDCCVVPKNLILFAKERGIKLLTHNDCSNILPDEHLKEVLQTVGYQKTVWSKWVLKYSIVVRDRGVVENKGYRYLALVEEK
ncbi:putative glutamate--cysteine ligase regulatory subunit [Neolecta irregularis DAH-3]|uniref:GCS light chain n=1 Tax=Neolecta irregularis (strain DAH-3) TaxID=1198029 RepID=A0A1U7LQ26_NEOID|nr:putative glutamate--cysteine ligase regulatory subunit [Neolecta irregularis DAH-3]|eukprot:OLL24728.1 putative glutamate--cysteine ligase regulatory subunit [Neolecta irregularis DAH-3]